MARKDSDIQVTDEELLPDGASLDDMPDDDDDFDIGNLRVNFSEKEESSEARDFTPIPTGKYHVAITDVEVKKCGPESKNPGKPFYAITVTVQDGPFENRKLWGNVMLFEGALYSLVQILKAQGLALSGRVPTPDELIGTHYVCQVANQVDEYKVKKDGWVAADGPKPRKNEIKNWAKYDGNVPVNGQSSAADSMLP
jgi:hypothetical protein